MPLPLWIEEQVKGFFTEVDVDKNQLIFTWEEIGKSGTFLGTSDSDTSKLEYTNTLLQRGSPIWYINHSCNANAGLRGSVSIIAMRDIKVGEEVVVDYFSQYKRDSLVYDMQLRRKELPDSNMSYENSPAKL